MPIQSPADVAAIDDPATLLAEGRAAAARNDKPTARAALRKAVKLDPANSAAQIALAEVVGTFSERRQILEDVLAREPENMTARAALEALDAGAANPHPPQPELPPIDPRPAPTQIATCYRHPDRETGLHCIQCSRPICAKCAFPTPVGAVCPECRKERRSPLYNVTPLDLVKAGAAGLVAGAIGAFAASFLGRVGFFFLFFILAFVGPLIGETVMRIITWATNKRGRAMQITTSVAIAAGGLALSLFWPVGVLPLLVFLAFAIGTVVQRLR